MPEMVPCRPRSDRPAAAPHRPRRLTRSFQTVRAYDELTLLENLCVASQENDGIGWLKALVRGKDSVRPTQQPRREARDLLAIVGLADYAGRRRRSSPMASASC